MPKRVKCDKCGATMEYLPMTSNSNIMKIIYSVNYPCLTTFDPLWRSVFFGRANAKGFECPKLASGGY